MIMGYLVRRKGELRMPRGAAREIGARFDGPVLNGERSLNEQVLIDDSKVRDFGTVLHHLAGGEVYVNGASRRYRDEDVPARNL
jgi:hypothetical protein